MFDTEIFICEIEKRPAIYDIKSKEYSNRDVKAKMWEEVAMVMYKNWNELPIQERNKLGRYPEYFSYIIHTAITLCHTDTKVLLLGLQNNL